MDDIIISQELNIKNKKQMINEILFNKNNKNKEILSKCIIKDKIKINKKVKSININRYLKNINFLIIRKPNKFPILLIYLLIVINMVFLIYSRKIEINFLNEIKIKIKGEETQNILNREFYPPPDEITVNGENSNILSENKITNLNNRENIIIMKWNSKITIATNMFSGLDNLIEVDLSNFDMSEIEKTNYMFSECAFLASINLNNLNAPLLTNMGGCLSFVNPY